MTYRSFEKFAQVVVLVALLAMLSLSVAEYVSKRSFDDSVPSGIEFKTVTTLTGADCVVVRSVAGSVAVSCNWYAANGRQSDD